MGWPTLLVPSSKCTLVESSEEVERMEESCFPTSEFFWQGNISYSVDLSTNGRKR